MNVPIVTCDYWNIMIKYPWFSVHSGLSRAVSNLRSLDQQIIDSIPGFYKYKYDGNEQNYIKDGGSDMYDGGNEVIVSSFQ